MARHGVGVAVTRMLGQSVPYATGIVNVFGCLVMGMLAGAVAAGSLRLGEEARVFVFVGILGGFTTFSSFGLDTLTLTRGGSGLSALVNVAVQLGLGLGGVFLGYWMTTAHGRA
jgi:CrcB protein